MNDVLLKLNDIVEEAEKVLAGLKKRKEELDFSHELLNKGHEELKTKTADIAQRESAIEPIENIQLALKDIDKKKANIQDGLAKLSEAQKSFESYKTIETEKLNNLRISVEKENNNVVQGYKNLEAEVDKRVKDFVNKHLNIK